MTNCKCNSCNTCTSCTNDKIYELNTYNKTNAKDNISIIKTSFTSIKSALSQFINDVSDLYDNVDTDGYSTSLSSYNTLQTNLVNDIKINCNKLLSNDTNAIPLKVISNDDKLEAIDKDNKVKKNYILGNLDKEVIAKNTNRDNLTFDNSTDNKILLTVGNNCTNPQISVGSVVLIEKTTNYNGFYQVESINTAYSNGVSDGVYSLFAYGLTSKATEYHSQVAKISVYNSAQQEVTIGASTTTTKSYILGTAGTQVNANTSNLSSITLSCDVNGQITVTAGGGTPFNGYTTSSIIKIEGCSISSYNGYWLVAEATSDTVIKLYGGNTTTFNANNLASNNTTSDDPVVIITPYTSNTDISTTVAVGVSQSLSKNLFIGSAGTVIQGGVTTGVATLSFSETNGVIIITADAGTPFTLNFGDIVRIQNTTNYNYYCMVVEDFSSSNTLKLYAGSTLGVADEGGSSTPTVTPYTSNMIGTAISITEYKQFSLGTVTVANITADDSADSTLQFKNRTNDRITLEVGKGLSMTTITTGSILKIENTTNYNGTFSVKTIDTAHSSSSNGIYTLFAPGLKGNALEKYYSLAKLSIYYSIIEQYDPEFKDKKVARKFNVKIGNNKYLLFYVPGISLYIDNGYLLEIHLDEKNLKFDNSKKSESILSNYRISGKSAIPNSNDKLKVYYNQIISENKDENNINSNTDINNLISKLNNIIKNLSYIENASYLK